MIGQTSFVRNHRPIQGTVIRAGKREGRHVVKPVPEPDYADYGFLCELCGREIPRGKSRLAWGEKGSIVLGGLEEAGYSCWPFVVGADDVGSPHRRKRVWIVAYRKSDDGRLLLQPRKSREACSQPERISEIALADPRSGLFPQPGRRSQGRDGAGSASAALGDTERSRLPGIDRRRTGAVTQDGHEEVADSIGAGLEGRQGVRGDTEPELSTTERGCDRMGDSEECRERAGLRAEEPRGERGGRHGDTGSGPTQSRLGDAAHGLPGWMARWPARPREAQYEWEAPRTIKGQKDRAARLKALGNAVVPQVAYAVLRAIDEYERHNG